YKCKCGLWVKRGNKRLLNWYGKCGFKRHERKNLQNDIWLEKSYNTKTDYFKSKLDDKEIEAIDRFYKFKAVRDGK
ncbi:MAG: hypothetical protein ACRCX2_36890, partial [Paraclostridium sp.]